LLVKLRHPNIVQFLGAVTERKPLMLITEYLRGVQNGYHALLKLAVPSLGCLMHIALLLVLGLRHHLLMEGDLHQYLKEKGSLNPSTAINFALDIARCLLLEIFHLIGCYTKK